MNTDFVFKILKYEKLEETYRVSKLIKEKIQF